MDGKREGTDLCIDRIQSKSWWTKTMGEKKEKETICTGVPSLSTSTPLSIHQDP